MSQAIAWQRVYWKELRQLMPLAAGLVVLAVLQYAWWAVVGGPSVDSARAVRTQFGPNFAAEFIFFGLPILFAVGAGAVLVSAEKDSRSIDWLRALPITAGRLIRVKLVASIVGLIALWAVSWLLCRGFELVSGMRAATDLTGQQGQLAVYLLQSVYLLLLGLATAWACRSTFAGLLLIIPFVALPHWFADAVFGRDENGVAAVTLRQEAVWMTSILLCVGIVVAGTAAWNLGLRSLSELAPRPRVDIPAEAMAVRRKVLGKPLRPTQALLWQGVRQDAVVWVGAFAGFAAFMAWVLVLREPFWLRALTASIGIESGLVAWTLVPFGLWSVLAGVWSIQSDRLHRRSDFIAHRGISSTRYLASRLAIPLLGLAALALLCFALMVFMPYGYLALPSRRVPALAGVAAAAVLVPASQWLALWFRSPTLAIVIIPPILCVLNAYYAALHRLLGYPLWLGIVVFVLFVAATRMSLPGWLDGRRGLRFWWLQGIVVALTLLLPAMPFAAFVGGLPRMPAAVREEISAAADDVGPVKQTVNMGEAWELSRQLPPVVETRDAAATLDLLQRLEDYYAGDTAATIEYGAYWRALADVVRWWEQESEVNLGAAEETLKDAYRSAIANMTMLAKRLREIPSVDINESADAAELLIFRSVRRPDARSELGEAVYRDAVRLVGDYEGRRQSRLRATSASYRAELLRRSGGRYVAGGSLAQSRDWWGKPVLREHPTYNAWVDRYYTELWLMAKSQDDADRERRLAIAGLWAELNPSFHVDGVGSPAGVLEYKRRALRDPFPLPFEGWPYRYIAPGSLWFLQWEHDAAEFAAAAEVRQDLSSDLEPRHEAGGR